MTKFDAPEIPETYSLFAKEVAEIAKKHGIQSFSMDFEPDYRQQVSYSIHGKLRINFSAKDGRGRPADNLSITLETSLLMTISETPESSN